MNRFRWWRFLMGRYWRWKSGWSGCCHKKQQCRDCPMRAWDHVARKDIRFVGALKDGHWEDENGVRYGNYPPNGWSDS